MGHGLFSRSSILSRSSSIVMPDFCEDRCAACTQFIVRQGRYLRYRTSPHLSQDTMPSVLHPPFRTLSRPVMSSMMRARPTSFTRQTHKEQAKTLLGRCFRRAIRLE